MKTQKIVIYCIFFILSFFSESLFSQEDNFLTESDYGTVGALSRNSKKVLQRVFTLVNEGYLDRGRTFQSDVWYNLPEFKKYSTLDPRFFNIVATIYEFKYIIPSFYLTNENKDKTLGIEKRSGAIKSYALGGKNEQKSIDTTEIIRGIRAHFEKSIWIDGLVLQDFLWFEKTFFVIDYDTIQIKDDYYPTKPVMGFAPVVIHTGQVADRGLGFEDFIIHLPIKTDNSTLTEDEKSLCQDMSVKNHWKFGQAKVPEQNAQYSTPMDHLTLQIWDDNAEDNDIVDIYLDGALFESNFVIQNKYDKKKKKDKPIKEIIIPMSDIGKVRKIELIAVSQGRYAECTMRLRIPEVKELSSDRGIDVHMRKGQKTTLTIKRVEK